MTTKIYRNDSDQTLNILGIGEIPPGEQVSISGEYLPPVMIENHPGLVDVLAEEVANPDVPSDDSSKEPK